MGIGKKDINKNLIIETALRLIDEKGCIKDVNLRGIAREIGCAHTSIYNYFNSYDEIIWEALGQVLLKMMDSIESYTNSIENDDEKIFLVFSSIIDFSIEHPGWFRLIWLDAIGGKPSPEVFHLLLKPGEGLKELLIKASGDELTGEQAIVIGDILHTYMHGELCKWVNNRSFTNGIEETKMKLLSNIRNLYRLLTGRGVNEP